MVTNEGALTELANVFLQALQLEAHADCSLLTINPKEEVYALISGLTHPAPTVDNPHASRPLTIVEKGLLRMADRYARLHTDS